MRILAVVAMVCFTISRAAAADTLVVHEWGTFTALQDESGQTLGGINVDEEGLPAFTHDIASGFIDRLNDVAPGLSKGGPTGSPDVTMRLETPVIYFHPGTADAQLKVDVSVSFHGGWLTQFYPDAEAIAPGVGTKANKWHFSPLTATTTGSLAWRGLSIGSAPAGPPTTQRVWLAPRQVEAAPVTTVAGEHERFLFYRGLGHLDAPLRVTRSTDGGTLAIKPQVDSALLALGASMNISRLWLVDIRADGVAAFRTGPGLPLSGAARELAANFVTTDYAPERLTTLRASMAEAMVADGLFADEATALLNTWEASYFKSPGLRLFFLVPRAWTDHYLPLNLSLPAQLERVMVGRIELVSPQQRDLLRTIAASQAIDKTWFSKLLLERIWKMIPDKPAEFRPGGKELQEKIFSEPGALLALGVEMPADYRAYLGLGRFRDVLMRNERRVRPSPQLTAFIRAYEVEIVGKNE